MKTTIGRENWIVLASLQLWWVYSTNEMPMSALRYCDENACQELLSSINDSCTLSCVNVTQFVGSPISSSEAFFNFTAIEEDPERRKL